MPMGGNKREAAYSADEGRVLEAYWAKPLWQRYRTANDALIRAAKPIMARNLTKPEIRDMIERLCVFMPDDELLNRVRRLPDVKGNANLASVSKSRGCKQLRRRGVLRRSADGVFIDAEKPGWRRPKAPDPGPKAIDHVPLWGRVGTSRAAGQCDCGCDCCQVPGHTRVELGLPIEAIATLRGERGERGLDRPPPAPSPPSRARDRTPRSSRSS